MLITRIISVGNKKINPYQILLKLKSPWKWSKNTWLKDYPVNLELTCVCNRIACRVHTYVRSWYIIRTHHVEATEWLPPTARWIGEREREEKRRKEVERKHNRIVNIVFWVAESDLCIYTGVCLLNFLLLNLQNAILLFLSPSFRVCILIFILSYY